jgi:hypothetical protein
MYIHTPGAWFSGFKPKGCLLLDFRNRMFSVIVPKGSYTDEGHVLSSLRYIDLRVLVAFIVQSRCPTWRSTHLVQNLNAEGTSRLRIQPSMTKFSNKVSLTLTSNDVDYRAVFAKDVMDFFWHTVAVNGCHTLFSSMSVAALVATFENHGVVIYAIANVQNPLDVVVHTEITDWYPGESPDNLMRCIRRTTDTDEDGARRDDERWKVYRNSVWVHSMVLAFSMAFHKRVGSDSAASVLSHDIFRMIGTEALWGHMGYTDILHVLNHR